MALERGLKSVRKNSNPDVPAAELALTVQTVTQTHTQRVRNNNLVRFILVVPGIAVYDLSDFL
jgi:hypothetical protein